MVKKLVSMGMDQEQLSEDPSRRRMTEYGLARSRSQAIIDSASVFAYPLSKTYSVPNISQYSADYTRYHGLRTYSTVKPRAYPTYRSYFPYHKYSSSQLRSLYWNDKDDRYNNCHSRALQPRHFVDYYATNPFFMNHSFTFHPNKYTYNWNWYGYKLPSYYRYFYYVSPYYDYYCNNTYNYAHNYR
uniref:Uncharacterized protein n=1 Tax=Globodera rostochiensis TaxID=31243 RepID=A0A914I7V6_GLORO